MTASTEVSGHAYETKEYGFCRFASHMSTAVIVLNYNQSDDLWAPLHSSFHCFVLILSALGKVMPLG